jgi:hypothetical protein
MGKENAVNAPIQECTWARFRIDGVEHGWINDAKAGYGKDIRVIGHEVSEWREREGHRLTIDMITGVFDRGITTLIIGIGHFDAVIVPEDVIAHVKNRGISDVALLSTPAACTLFNQKCAAGEQVALLAHGTC